MIPTEGKRKRGGDRRAAPMCYGVLEIVLWEANTLRRFSAKILPSRLVMPLLSRLNLLASFRVAATSDRSAAARPSRSQPRSYEFSVSSGF